MTKRLAVQILLKILHGSSHSMVEWICQTEAFGKHYDVWWQCWRNALKVPSNWILKKGSALKLFTANVHRFCFCLQHLTDSFLNPFLELGRNPSHMVFDFKFPITSFIRLSLFHPRHHSRVSISRVLPLFRSRSPLASSHCSCSGCGPSILICRRAPTPAATVVVHGVAVVTLHSPVLHLSCTGLSQGGHSSWLIVAAQTQGRTECESQPLSSYPRKKKGF